MRAAGLGGGSGCAPHLLSQFRHVCVGIDLNLPRTTALIGGAAERASRALRSRTPNATRLHALGKLDADLALDLGCPAAALGLVNIICGSELELWTALE